MMQPKLHKGNNAYLIGVLLIAIILIVFIWIWYGRELSNIDARLKQETSTNKVIIKN